MTTRSTVQMCKQGVWAFSLIVIAGCSATRMASTPPAPTEPLHATAPVSESAVRQAAATDPDLMLFGADPARQIVGEHSRQTPASHAAAEHPVPVAGQPAVQLAGHRAVGIASSPSTELINELSGSAGDPQALLTLSVQQQTFTEVGRDFDPDVDAAGKMVVFASTRHSSRPSLYLQSVKGRAVTQLTGDPASEIQPRFNADGKKIAFASDRSGQWDIYILDLERRTTTQVTHSQDHELAPAWSPDGKWLAYSRLASGTGGWELWMASLEDGAERCIGQGLMPRFSPDGTRIAFQKPRERDGRLFSIWTVQLNNDEPSWPTEVAAEHGAALICPVWSPDGTKIAYCRVPASGLATGANGGTAKPGLADIFVVSLEGAEHEQLTDGGASFSPCWSSEGRLYFSADRDGRERIWSLKTAGPGKPNLASTAMNR